MKRYSFKVLLLGAPTVGKTSIFYRYVKNRFIHDYITTIGINYLTKEITLEAKMIAKLVILDIGGQKKFKFLHKKFYILLSLKHMKQLKVGFQKCLKFYKRTSLLLL